jgi:hypothetical protein
MNRANSGIEIKIIFLCQSKFRFITNAEASKQIIKFLIKKITLSILIIPKWTIFIKNVRVKLIKLWNNDDAKQSLAEYQFLDSQRRGH